mmetsp:Transcript_56119/g.144827  ORF Transcript_56119/g.144827 Transcript_56119/m.144827 type:complete len:461 (-) Transcript_56119:138-1520(-)
MLLPNLTQKLLNASIFFSDLSCPSVLFTEHHRHGLERGLLDAVGADARPRAARELDLAAAVGRVALELAAGEEEDTGAVAVCRLSGARGEVPVQRRAILEGLLDIAVLKHDRSTTVRPHDLPEAIWVCQLPPSIRKPAFNTDCGVLKFAERRGRTLHGRAGFHTLRAGRGSAGSHRPLLQQKSAATFDVGGRAASRCSRGCRQRGRARRGRSGGRRRGEAGGGQRPLLQQKCTVAFDVGGRKRTVNFEVGGRASSRRRCQRKRGGSARSGCGVGWRRCGEDGGARILAERAALGALWRADAACGRGGGGRRRAGSRTGLSIGHWPVLGYGLPRRRRLRGPRPPPPPRAHCDAFAKACRRRCRCGDGLGAFGRGVADWRRRGGGGASHIGGGMQLILQLVVSLRKFFDLPLQLAHRRLPIALLPRELLLELVEVLAHFKPLRRVLQPPARHFLGEPPALQE